MKFEKATVRQQRIFVQEVIDNPTDQSRALPYGDEARRPELIGIERIRKERRQALLIHMAYETKGRSEIDAEIEHSWSGSHKRFANGICQASLRFARQCMRVLLEPRNSRHEGLQLARLNIQLLRSATCAFAPL